MIGDGEREEEEEGVEDGSTVLELRTRMGSVTREEKKINRERGREGGREGGGREGGRERGWKGGREGEREGGREGEREGGRGGTEKGAHKPGSVLKVTSSVSPFTDALTR